MASPVFFQALQPFYIEATSYLYTRKIKKNKPIFFSFFFLFHRSHLPVHKEDGSCGGKKDEPEPQEDVDLKIFIVCPFASLTVNLVEMVLSCSSPFH